WMQDPGEQDCMAISQSADFTFTFTMDPSIDSICAPKVAFADYFFDVNQFILGADGTLQYDPGGFSVSNHPASGPSQTVTFLETESISSRSVPMIRLANGTREPLAESPSEQVHSHRPALGRTNPSLTAPVRSSWPVRHLRPRPRRGKKSLGP